MSAARVRRLVLASESPRRRELLTRAGIAFAVDPASVDESPWPGEVPEQYVARLAVAKASAVLARHVDAIVLGADTTVVLSGEMLGKPESDDEAAAMLRKLSGRSHEVLTGVALATGEAVRSAVVRTTVWMDDLTDADIARYIASGEPRDKAGAYAIQGLASQFIPRIDGSYTNVVGLPVAQVVRMLKDLEPAAS